MWTHAKMRARPPASRVIPIVVTMIAIVITYRSIFIVEAIGLVTHAYVIVIVLIVTTFFPPTPNCGSVPRVTRGIVRDCASTKATTAIKKMASLQRSSASESRSDAKKSSTAHAQG